MREQIVEPRFDMVNRLGLLDKQLMKLRVLVEHIVGLVLVKRIVKLVLGHIVRLVLEHIVRLELEHIILEPILELEILIYRMGLFRLLSIQLFGLIFLLGHIRLQYHKTLGEHILFSIQLDSNL